MNRFRILYTVSRTPAVFWRICKVSLAGSFLLRTQVVGRAQQGLALPLLQPPQGRECNMPYKSKAQAAYFNIHKKQLEKQGVNVNEWNEASKGKKLPKKAKKK